MSGTQAHLLQDSVLCIIVSHTAYDRLTEKSSLMEFQIYSAPEKPQLYEQPSHIQITQGQRSVKDDNTCWL